jgi:uncharacterized damage-inducible protein DinB
MTFMELKLLHAFNAWASNRVFDAVGQMPEAEVTRDMKTSHGSIHATLVHMVGAEKMWLSRWLGTPDRSFLSTAEVPTLADVRAGWERVGFETARFIGTMNDRKLQETFTMTTAKGESFVHTYGQAFQHVVDHGTYHRGQVVAMMRQLGVVPPSTGLIIFYRETTRT